SSRSNPPLQTTLPISFLIIGGGIAGLACAIALRRVGHHALVLERRDRQDVCSDTGIRLPPNCTKILFHWGLRNALIQKATVTHTLVFSRYETGEFLGCHKWDPQIMKETRGLFMLMTHAELYQILYDAAVALGIEIRYGAEVQEIDPSSPSVQLASGEVESADVIVGADGEFGISRPFVAGEDRAKGTPAGVALYDSSFSTATMLEFARAFHTDNGQLVAFGYGRAVLAYPIHQGNDFAFQWYGPDDGPDGQYGQPPSADVHRIEKPSHESLRLVMANTRRAVRISARHHQDLEDWIADDSRLVLIGESAHPFPPGTIQGTAMAIEDGAVLAKLFSHLSEERQIENFLYAFQELRQSRVSEAREREIANVFFMTLPEGADASARDDAMRANTAAGRSVLEASGEGAGAETKRTWEEMEVVFGYDCEDAADDWWMQWGVLQERALGNGGVGTVQTPSTGLFDFSSMTVQVSSTTVDVDES
ncbi:FAD/NAD-P-binding domain-containing protein, partial [Trametes maxima]